MKKKVNNPAEIPPKRKPGKNAMNGKYTGKSFTKEYRPDPEKVKAGVLKAKRARELASAILNLSFKGANKQLKKATAAYYGIPESEITVEMMMLFQQTKKAIQDSDTFAFNAVMDRAHGKPSQSVELSNKEGEVFKFGYGDEKPV